jgi:16S rRNA (uracil1498-N3)-methyltransferase
MVHKQNQKHLFALYTAKLKIESWVVGQSIVLDDVELMHRMIKVLRFEINDQVVLFNQNFHAQIMLQQISKKNIVVQVLSIQTHQPLQPEVTFLLPLLKKEALEQAVYSLCELGISSIQLVITEKSRQQLLHEKEFVRLQNIVIAAAEQSKNYALCKLFAAKKLTEIVNQQFESKLFKIVFDPAGASFFSINSQVQENSTILLAGPEGGLTDQELQLVQDQGFVLCALTSTILTAVQAVALGAGLFRLKKTL